MNPEEIGDRSYLKKDEDEGPVVVHVDENGNQIMEDPEGMQEPQESEADRLARSIQEMKMLVEKNAKKQASKSAQPKTNSIDYDDDDDDDDDFGPMPVSGPKSVPEEKPVVEDFSNQKVHLLPPGYSDSDDDFEDEYEEEEDNNDSANSNAKDSQSISETLSSLEETLPFTGDIVLNGHTKGVRTIAIDSTGMYAVSGSQDCSLQLWDYSKMDSRLKPTATPEAEYGCPVTCADFAHSSTVSVFVASSFSACPKIFDHKGNVVSTFAKGDVYIHDLTHTKGHVQPVTHVSFRPKDDRVMLTASIDGTLRLWDVDRAKDRHNSIVKAVIKTPRARAAVSAACWCPEGTFYAGGVPLEGSIQVWDQRLSLARPFYIINNAHERGADIGSLIFLDDHRLASRCADETLKVWDLRGRLEEPVSVCRGIPVSSTTIGTGMCLSPDGSMLLTGSKERLVVLSANEPAASGNSLLLVKTKVMPSAVLQANWDPASNEVYVGLDDGTVHVLHDLEKSKGGVLECARKVPTSAKLLREEESAGVTQRGFIFTPEEYDIEHRELSEEKLIWRARKEDLKRRMEEGEIPARPSAQRESTELGVNGKLGTSLSQYLLWRDKLIRPEVEVDPREALLRHAKKPNTGENPQQ